MENKEIPICRRCGRKLKSPESKERGMGDTCYKKHISKNNHKNLLTSLQKEKNSI